MFVTRGRARNHGRGDGTLRMRIERELALGAFPITELGVRAP
jgi:hypothetical protein